MCARRHIHSAGMGSLLFPIPIISHLTLRCISTSYKITFALLSLRAPLKSIICSSLSFLLLLPRSFAEYIGIRTSLLEPLFSCSLSLVLFFFLSLYLFLLTSLEFFDDDIRRPYTCSVINELIQGCVRPGRYS